MKKSTSPRVMLIVAGILILVPFLVPIWQIQISAPQYPEGMGLKIWVNKITGENPNDLQTLNGLNHYIGMKVITPEDIPELQYMPYILLMFSAGLLLLSVKYKDTFLRLWLLLFTMTGLLGMYDFYKWEYDYGHNLNPDAPIKVPGMNYQPPLLGSKQLLNINATSLPDIGTYALLAAVVLAGVVVYREKKQSNIASGPGAFGILLATGMAFTTSTCSGRPVPISYGKDNCAECEMTITDQRFGTECVSEKGKTYWFDSIECMVYFAKGHPGEFAGKASFYVTDYMRPGTFIAAENAKFTHDTRIKSPMGENLAAFATEEDGKKMLGDSVGFYVWQSLPDILKE